jgi:hypothetical protein
MSEQPSEEALWLVVYSTGLELAEGIDELCDQRVSAETERWQNRDRQRLEQIARLQETVQSFQSAPAERPAPPQQQNLRELLGGSSEAVSETWSLGGSDLPRRIGVEQPTQQTGEPGCGMAETARSRAASIVGTWQDLHVHLYTDVALDDLELRIAHALRDTPSAIASTGEQPASPAVVGDYTERALAVSRRWAEANYGPNVGPLSRLTEMIADALSAVASERDAAAIRAFGQRVWSDTEEVAYQAGVSDTRARLREPNVREAVKAALEQGRPHWITGVGPGGSGLGGMADAAIAKIAEMLK